MVDAPDRLRSFVPISGYSNALSFSDSDIPV